MKAQMTTAAGNGTVASVRVWDVPVRVFHWLLVISFGAAYLLGDSERWRQIHVMFGYTVLGLIAFRILWGFVGTRYARFTSFLHGPRAALRYVGSLASRKPEHHVGHNPAGSWAVYAMLALGVATGLSGYLTLNEFGGDAVEELHEILANTWLVVVFVHVAGVIASSVAHRENLARAMLTGYKRGDGESIRASVSSPRRPIVGVLLASAVLIFWLGSLLIGGPTIIERSSQATMAQTAEDDDD
ncbi:MAG: cytochrome b/b6 domain-containing protein [Pseudomonadales bacterium]|nr:cytochrome b/b6 domain-containing protein [Pseudomonadales bacterium]